MDYTQWMKMFRKSADDAQVRSAVVTAGITKPLKIRRDELSVRADIKGQGMTIIFSDESVLPPSAGGTAGSTHPVWVSMILQSRQKDNIYKGPLPYDLKVEETQAAVPPGLGIPAKPTIMSRRISGQSMVWSWL